MAIYCQAATSPHIPSRLKRNAPYIPRAEAQGFTARIDKKYPKRSYWKERKETNVQDLWERIEAWLQREAPEELLSLQPGATDWELQEAETVLGITLPEEVKASYRIHNGGALIADPTTSDWWWELLCLEDIVRDWNLFRRFDHGLLAPLQPEEQVQSRNWDLQWIPILEAHTLTRQRLCLDLAPGPAGHAGQIIEVDWTNCARPVIAPSFRDLLVIFASDLEAGHYMWNEEEGTLEQKQSPSD